MGVAGCEDDVVEWAGLLKVTFQVIFQRVEGCEIADVTANVGCGGGE